MMVPADQQSYWDIFLTSILCWQLEKGGGLHTGYGLNPGGDETMEAGASLATLHGYSMGHGAVAGEARAEAGRKLGCTRGRG